MLGDCDCNDTSEDDNDAFYYNDKQLFMKCNLYYIIILFLY